MAFTTKLNLINQKFEQTTGGTLTLSGTTNIASTGKLEYLTNRSSYFNVTPRAVPDVAYVTGRTANKLDTPIFTGYTAATQTMYNDVGDPTGFVDNENIVVSYNSTNRTITLSAATGNVEYYYKGVKHTLSNPWTSTGHTAGTDAYFLYSDNGINFAWRTAVWDYDDVQVAAVPANSTFAIREVHGTMPWETHQELHRTIGTYRVSGFGFTVDTYEIQPISPVDADNTPGFEAGTIADEDLQTSLSAWSEGTYTRLYFTSGGTVNFESGNALFRVGTTYPKINVWSGTFSENETVSGSYFNYYVIRIPVTADAGSQLYRAVVLQPQYEYGSLEAAQAENPLSINLGNFSNLAPEFVLVERITMHASSAYTGAAGQVRIEAVSILTGAKFNQTSTTPGAGTVTAGNVSVTPLDPFTSTNMQDLSDDYAQCFNALDVITDLALTGATGSYIGTIGRNVCIDATGQIILGAALTGTTNGLSDDGRIACLGGTLTSDITFTGGASDYHLKYADNYSFAYTPYSIPDVNYVSGLTSDLSGRVDALETWSATTETRVDNLETWSATTETRVDNLETWSATTETRVDNLETWSGVTNGRLDTIEGQYITGGTSGLLPDGVDVHSLKLGGELTETTTLFGSEILNINVNKLNLTGATSGVTISGDVFVRDLIGVNDLVCVNATTGQLGTTSLSAFGGITGGTNGIVVCDFQRLGLGGALCADTSICGAGNDLSLGTAGSKLDLLNVHTSGNVGITSDANLVMSLSGGTIATGDLKGLRYTTDYSTTFVDNSLVTKLYVDTVASGLDPKSAVLVATTGSNLDLSGTETIDGISLVGGERVLVKDQTDKTENGIYIVNSGGTWTRATDFDGTPEGEVTEGALIPVLSGSTNINSSWILITKDPITIDTTLLTFTKFSQLLDISAGDGIRIDTVGETKEINIQLASPSSGLEIDGSGDLKIDLTDNSGLQLLSSGLTVNSAIAGNALDWSAGVINVNIGDINTQLGGVLSATTNGLSETTTGIAELGGTLTKPTTITLNSDSNTLTFTDTSITNKDGILYGGVISGYTFVDNSLVSKYYVDGLTSNLEDRVDALETWSATTEVRVDNLETWSATTETRVDNLETWSATTETRVDNLETWSATTETRVDNLETDVTALGAISGITLVSITGATNGLTKVGDHDVCLGGTLDSPVTIDVNSQYFELYGCTNNYLNFSSGQTYICHRTGISTNSNFYVNNSAIAGSTTGTFCFYSDTMCLLPQSFYLYFNNGGVIDDANGTPSGLTYAGDYSATFVDNSLITKKYVDDLIATSAVTASNGLTAVNNDIQLGGILSTSTVISGARSSLSLGVTNSALYDFNVYACNDVYVCGRNQVYLTTCGNDAYIQIDNVSDNINISSKNNVNVTADSDDDTGGVINLTGTITVVTEPAAGDTATDSVLVRAGDGTVKQIPSTSLGQDNNDYSMTVITGATTLTTGSSYTILVDHAGTLTVTLPSSPFDGQAFKFKDASGNALQYPITIAGGGNLIDGSSSVLINTDFGALEMVYNLAQDEWYILSFVN